MLPSSTYLNYGFILHFYSFITSVLLLSPRYSVYLFDRFESLEIAKVVLVLKSFFSPRSLGVCVSPFFGPRRQNQEPAFILTNGDNSCSYVLTTNCGLFLLTFRMRSFKSSKIFCTRRFLTVSTGVSSSLHS